MEVAFQAAELGCAVTLVGDPRQALYSWRGATPDQVATLLNATTDSFVDYQQSHSFRFTGQQMPRLAAMLRSGCPVSIPNVLSADVDIALARRWRHLWLAGDNVLPLAFRNINNATDAAVNLLLDVATRARFGRPSYGREAAITQLRLDGGRVAQDQDSVLRPILAELRDGGPPAEALDKLRGAVVCLGAARRPNRLKDQAEHNREEELGWLSVRLGQPALVPGLTVYQAKGGEWPRVGVVLTDHENQLLANGLRELEDDHCVLYVALTRAEHLCGRLAATATLEIDQDD